MFHINESAGNHIPVLFRQTIVINQLILLTQTKKNKRLKGWFDLREEKNNKFGLWIGNILNWETTKYEQLTMVCKDIY